MKPAELAASLIEIDSRNPTLVPDAPGEHQAALFLASVLEAWNFDVQLQRVAPGRENVIARAGRANPDKRSLILNGHLDVVGTDGMTHDPFAPRITDDEMFGRGSADMKGGIAAMCVAARNAVERGIAGEVIITAVVDEEYESLGTRTLIASGVRADAAIITEPTRLALCPAHRGFVWARLQLHGHAAHGSRYDLGVDAITHAALVIGELDRIQREVLYQRSHPLLGRPSLHASLIHGGTGISTYPDLCTVEMERRTLPGEDADTFIDEITTALAAVRQNHPELRADTTITTSQLASDVPLDAPVMVAMLDALENERMPAPVQGLSAWTDAALLNEAGVPTICFGPGDIALAHSATEWVPIAEVDAAARVLEQLVSTWCNSPR